MHDILGYILGLLVISLLVKQCALTPDHEQCVAASHESDSSSLLVGPKRYCQSKVNATDDEEFNHESVLLTLAKQDRNRNETLKEKISRLESFNLHQFLVKFVINHLRTNEELKLSRQCFSQLSNLRNDLINSYRGSILEYPNYWSQRVLDSFGRSPSGLLKMDGDFFWSGDFHECIRTQNEQFNGKYCILKTGYLPEFDWYFPPMLKLGICMPDACTADESLKIVNKAYDLMPTEYSQVLGKFEKEVECKEKNPLTLAAKITLLIVIGIVSLVAAATYYDVKLQSMEPSKDSSGKPVEHSKSVQLFLSFSAYTNSVRLFDTKSHPMDIEPLNAIRALSQGWIVASHSLSYMLPVLDNTRYFLGNKEDFKYIHEMIIGKVIEQGFFAVDSFFLISGLLTGFIGLDIFSKPGFRLTPGNVLKFYVYRFLRLTPPYFLVFLISATLSPYSGQGPLYPRDGFEKNRCSNDWWTNVLLINNLDVTEEKCFHQSWFLACDMQINLLAPFLLFFLTKSFSKLNVGLTVCLGLLVANIVTTFRIASNKDMHFFFYHDNIYIKPWTRMGTYLVGLILGYILYNVRVHKKFILKNNRVIKWAWIVTLVLTFLLVFGFNYIPQRFHETDFQKLLMTAYEATFKIVWASCLSYMIYACMISRGGVIAKIFAWPIWKPLSKMSFSTFLVHTFIINYFVLNHERPLHVNKHAAWTLIVSNLVSSHIIGYACYILFEAPLAKLQRILLKA